MRLFPAGQGFAERAADTAETSSTATGPAPWTRQAFRAASERILSAINTVIDGKSEAAKLALTVLLAQGHLLLEDVPGVGKTLLAKTLARTIDCSVSRIQFTPDLLPSDVTGVSIYNQSSRQFEFRPGAVFANIVIGDEINRASAKTQSALLECMEEHQVTVDGTFLQTGRAVHGGGHPEPDRDGRDLPAAGSAAGPVHGTDLHGLPGQGLRDRNAGDPPGHVPVGEGDRRGDLRGRRGDDRHRPAGLRVPVRQGVHRGRGPRHARKRHAAPWCQPAFHAPAAPRGQGHRGPGRPGLRAAGRRRCVAESVLAHRIILDRKAASAGETPQSVIRGVLAKLPVSQEAGRVRPGAARARRPGRPRLRAPNAARQGLPWHCWTVSPDTSSPPEAGDSWRAGAVSLLAAQVMGRRDLLAWASCWWSCRCSRWPESGWSSPASRCTGSSAPPRGDGGRHHSPAGGRPDRAGAGHAIMEERLPARFGESPAFRFPARSASGGTSRYEYHLRSGKRGQFLIGPVTAEFTDPFGLSLHRHAIDDGDTLTVTPAAVELPVTGLAGARGNDGVTATRIRANPSDDDVMTREYRHGDPMRRVHWAATARHGALMVRQEESVTTPEATIILDQRFAAFTRGASLPARVSLRRRSPDGTAELISGAGGADGHELVTSDTFEWAVTAAMSISAHLAERNYALRFLDAAGEPAFLHSPSAPEPETEEYIGAAGLQSIAESLAAIQLSGPHHTAQGRARMPVPPVHGRPRRRRRSGPQPFDDRLMDKLSAHRMRGPVLAVLGRLSLAEASALAPAAGYAANAFAIVVTERAAGSPRRPRSAAARRLACGGRVPVDVPAGRMDGLRPGRGRPWQPPPTCGAARGCAMTLAPQRSAGARAGQSEAAAGPATPGAGSFPGTPRARRSAPTPGSWRSPWRSPCGAALPSTVCCGDGPGTPPCSPRSLWWPDHGRAPGPPGAPARDGRCAGGLC